MMNFTSLCGVIPREARTIKKVTAAGVSVKKELRYKISTSDKLKLSKSAREGGSDKFSFFETTGLIGSDFKAVYDLHMRIKALSKTLVFFDMIDVFQILPESTVKSLEEKLTDLHVWQGVLERCKLALLASLTDTALLLEKENAEKLILSTTSNLQATPIQTTYLIKSFKDIDEATIKRSNSYYARYGADWSAENMSWSSDRILNTCEDLLRDKARKGLVGVSALESGGPLVLKKTLDIVMDVDDTALRLLTESLQHLRMKDVPGKKVGTVVSYLKGDLLLLQNCSAISTDTMGLLNDVMSSAD